MDAFSLAPRRLRRFVSRLRRSLNDRLAASRPGR